jgi:hypothetical protein
MPRKILIPEANIRRQQKTQWCYAAVIQMVLEYYGRITTQEAIVKKITRSETNNDPQDPTLYLMKTLKYINNVPCGCSPSRVLRFTQIKREIDRRRPIIVRLTGGTGHYVLIVGYDVDAEGTTQVIYIDPNKSKHNKEDINIIDGVTTVNTIYHDADPDELLNGPSDIGGFCLTHPLGESSFPPSSSAKRKGGMKSKKSRKSGSTRKKIRGKSWRVRK